MTELNCFIEKFNSRLKGYIDGIKTPFKEQMEYVLFSGGKRLRPFMVYLGAKYTLDRELSDEEMEKVYDYAISVEMVHTYSLVHDDMPEMDNDDLRRGKPTAHKKFGCWQALLLGDALLNLAFERGFISEDKKAYKCLSFSSGQSGMVLGQYYDLSGVSSLDELLDMYSLKTSKLFIASLCGGASLFNSDEKTLEELYQYGYNLGIAFQIEDDLLEEKKEEQSILSYRTREDAEKLFNKFTFDAILSIESKGRDLASFASLLLKRKK